MKPNCIFIMADQLRYDVLGKGYTPNIDKLMKDSVNFSNAYCASPLCVPARGALFTGTYPGVNGSIINGWFKSEKSYSKVKAGIDNLYELMERLDMECIHSGKQHLFTEGELLEERENSKTKWLTTERSYKEFLQEHGKRVPGGKQFRTSVPEMSGGNVTRICNYSNPSTGVYEEGAKYYYDEYFTGKALDSLKDYDRKKPLFLSMMYLAPHPPLDIPEPWYSIIKSEDVHLPKNVGVWYEHQSPLQKYNLTGVVGNPYSIEQWKESWRVYMGLVALLDDCIGRILDELKRQRLYNNSIIVFGSDHGEMLGSHCLFQKMCMYEESVKTPLSIHLPESKNSGMVVEDYISHVDILPTICELYGIKTNHQMNGISLKSMIDEAHSINEVHLEKRPIYIQYDGNASRGNFQRCIILKGYKLIVDIFKDETYFELYDLEQDCQETTNLLFVDGNMKFAKEMCHLLIKHMNEMEDLVSFDQLSLEHFMSMY